MSLETLSKLEEALDINIIDDELTEHTSIVADDSEG